MTGDLAGTYKLLSFGASVDHGPWNDNLLGSNPSGYAMISATRFMAVLTAADRTGGTTVEERAALFLSLIAYTGEYRIEGNKFITAVDVSWNEKWVGTDQGRTWRLDGKQLTLLTDPAPNPLNPAQSVVYRVLWERVGAIH